MKLPSLALLAALGACATPAAESTPSPARCAEIFARPWSSGGDTTVRPTEQMPRPLNRRVIEGRLADSAASLPIDSVPRAVLLRWRLTAEGRPEQVSVVRSSGSPDFDAAAVWAMGLGEFEPARLDGCPVAVWIEAPLEIRFRPRRRRAPATPSGVQAPPRP
ncbi:MAG TPA: TonB family protein [Longimicrobium sp.]|nr:TonB family protein [Longimicrobium sp.]